MKKLYIASGLVALLAAATSCDKYDIYPEQYGEVMLIKNAGERTLTIYATDDASPCYVSVMKGGHTPENPAQATLKILSDSEFGDYKELYYGRRDFEGLVVMNPDFYHLEDASGNYQASGSLSHDFVDENDRYFGANVVFDAQKVSDWYERLVNASTYVANPKKETPEEIAKNEAEKKLAKDSLDNFTFVVPVGLFSETDSINSDNKYLMIIPSVTNPVLSVSIGSGGYQITEISRTALKEEDSAYRNGLEEPEVTMSIPCPNPYGFSVRYRIDDSFTKDFCLNHNDIVLTTLPMKDRETQTVNYELGGTFGRIEFPKGKTEVRVPLSLLRKSMNYDDMETNWVVPFQLVAAKAASTGIDMYWGDDVPVKVQKSLKLPENTVDYLSGYTFFVGYRVVETPLEIDEGCVVGYNDCEPSEGSVAGLFDDDLSTFYHSAWSEPVPRQAPYGSYIDFEIPTKDPINAVAIQITARVHSNPRSPKVVSLYYSNVANDAERDASWKELKLNVPVNEGALGSGKVGWIGGIKKQSDWIVSPEPFRYLRFCVIRNSADEDITTTGTKSERYWNLAEMKIYGTTIRK